MMPLHKHRRLIRQGVVACYLVAASFFLSHSINAYVEQQLIVPRDFAPGTMQPAALSAETIAPEQLAERIKHSGLFPLPAEAAAPQGPAGAPAKPKGPPLDVKRKLRLLGTMIAADGRSSAVLEEITSKHQGWFHLHDLIPNVGEVADIRRDGVLIRQDEQEELLPPAILQPNQPAAPPVPVTAQGTFVPQARRVLDRRVVAEATANVSKLLTQAHAVPHFGGNGQVDGFRFDFIAPASFFEMIGLQYGDLIQRVNGVEIQDPGKLWTLFQQLQNERTVKVDVVRNSQPTTLTYELR